MRSHSAILTPAQILAGVKPPKTPAQPMLTEIIPKKLFISNIEGAQNVDQIVSLGITHVVSVMRTKMNNIYPNSIKRLWIPVIDTATAVDDFEKIWPTPLEFLRDCMNQGGAALVHCRAGMSRSSTIVLAHMLQYYHMLLRDAWTHLSNKHPVASPITPFFNALINFEVREQCKLLDKRVLSISSSPSSSLPSPSSSSSSSSSLSSSPSSSNPLSSSPNPPSSSSFSSSSSKTTLSTHTKFTAPSTKTTSSTNFSSPSSSPLTSSSRSSHLSLNSHTVQAPRNSSSSNSVPLSSSPSSTSVSPSSSPTPSSSSSSMSAFYHPSISLLEYQMQMLRIIFPKTPERDFLEVVKQCNNNWLSAARLYHSRHPASLHSFAMRYGGGASPYHPFCDNV